MARGKKAITIQDVARTAGVSVSTVSRVLNDKDDVAPDTYQRVRDVIQEMGYTSSLAARSMRSRRTNVIGLIIPDVADSFSIQVMKGVNQAIFELDYDLIIYTSGSIKKRSAAEREQYFVSLLNGSIADGVVIVTPAATNFSTASPVVTIDPNSECPECLTIIAANHKGAMAAMEYLLGLGHRRIGFITGRPDLQCAERRLQGYQDALHLAGIPLDPDLIAAGDFSSETGRLCARKLLSLSEPPTAIFAANDQSAIATIETARDMGLRVPDDLSVVGFDNIPEATYFNPVLTTVDQFIDQMGRVATEKLIGLIQGEALESDSYKMPTQLVVRDTCRALADGASGAKQAAAPEQGAK